MCRIRRFSLWWSLLPLAFIAPTGGKTLNGVTNGIQQSLGNCSCLRLPVAAVEMWTHWTSTALYRSLEIVATVSLLISNRSHWPGADATWPKCQTHFSDSPLRDWRLGSYTLEVFECFTLGQLFSVQQRKKTILYGFDVGLRIKWLLSSILCLVSYKNI